MSGTIGNGRPLEGRTHAIDAQVDGLEEIVRGGLDDFDEELGQES